MIKVLDHGFIRLVDSMGSDLSVVRAARVSYDAAWRAGENEGSDRRLINYLWKHKHTTPFEAVTFTFEVYAPIFVIRQWHRHRTFSYNELSGRYRELPEVFYIPKPKHIGTQSENNKQGRDLAPPVLDPFDDSYELSRAVELENYVDTCKEAFVQYRCLLQVGWPRELARTVLPLSTYSHFFCTGNLRNVFHFLTLRTDSHAQYEIRVYAEAMLELIRPVVPICVAAWEGTAQ